MMSIAFEQGVKYVADNIGAYLGAHSAKQFVTAVDTQLNNGVDKMIDNLYDYVEKNHAPTSKLQGNAFERLQADSFNIRAELHNSDLRATVLNSTGKDSVDVQLRSQTIGRTVDYSMKSYSSASGSLNSQSKPSQGGVQSRSRYHGMGKIIPKDQIDEARSRNQEKINHAPSAADKARFEEVAKTLDSEMSDGKRTHSSGTTRARNAELTDQAREKSLDREKLKEELELTTENEISMADIMGKAFKAGLNAAVISFVISMAPTIINGISMLITEGEIDAEAFAQAGSQALPASAKAFINGSITAAIIAACEANCISVNSSFVSTAVVLTVGTIWNSVKYATGKITKAQMADEIARLHITTAFSVGGGLAASVWFAEIPPLAIAAYMLGSFIGGVVGGFAYNIGKSLFMSFCVDSGCTFFGIVDQDYQLPQEIMDEIGIEVFDYEKFEYDSFQYDNFRFDTFSPDTFQYDKFGITILRRGVIGVGKVGYE